jgi:hypothetical protein
MYMYSVVTCDVPKVHTRLLLAHAIKQKGISYYCAYKYHDNHEGLSLGIR